MGYYTWYTLDIIKDPDNQEEDFYEEFDEKTGLLFDFSNYNEESVARITHDGAMTESSTGLKEDELPNIISSFSGLYS